MPNTTKLIQKNMKNDTLALIVLNVGDGDANIVRFPPKYGDPKNGRKVCAVIDCYNAKKTFAALEALDVEVISFICATHPHSDHTIGLNELIRKCLKKNIIIEEFWDSGFRHVSKIHYNLIRLLEENPQIKIKYPTSGFETIINGVRVLVLSPSIALKNRYDTFGTNINNASIVIKLEYPPKDIANYYRKSEDYSDEDLAQDELLKQHKIILGGDAQFDAWARITQEFPELIKTQNRGQLIDANIVQHAPLRCQVLKVPHHMSKHGISLEVLETLRSRYTIAPCSNKSKHDFPHELTVMAIEDIHKKKKDTGIRFTGHPNKKLRSGSVVALFPENKTRPLLYELGDTVANNNPLKTLS
jgi:beta-lactamase superfamily II metal-dependent hydrolase